MYTHIRRHYTDRQLYRSNRSYPYVHTYRVAIVAHDDTVTYTTIHTGTTYAAEAVYRGIIRSIAKRDSSNVRACHLLTYDGLALASWSSPR